MKTTLLFIALSAPFTAICVANPEPATKPATESTVENAEAAINKDMADHDALMKKFMKKVRAEKDRKKTLQLYQQAPPATEYIARILALVEKHPKEASSTKGLAWSQRRSRSQKTNTRIQNIYLKHYINDKAINQYARSLSRSHSPDATKTLRQISENTTRKDTKVFATYYLATKLKSSAERGRNLTAEQRKAMADEATAIYKKLNTNPAVAKVNPKLAKQLGSMIFEMENLAIGSQAPEIKGDDHTGTQFKLSDYRGKVILLDFWGNW